MRGQHRPAEPLLKAFQKHEIASSHGVATSRGEKMCVEGLDGLKHKLICRPPETETQAQLGTGLTGSDPTCRVGSEFQISQFQLGTGTLKEFQWKDFGQCLQFC